ncbi:MAG TPA: gliding motility-associated C-terminal domain-containing protein [Bacteroidales bacterium]|nr:gliding motility-associated C-terminal domain-containing protein [Bacteroidales bacterium]
MKNLYIRIFLLAAFVLFAECQLFATHNRAGEITYVQKSDLTYEITLTTFTYTLSFADRPSLNIEWGDNTVSTAYRKNELMVTLPNYYRKNIYVIEHTYPGPGVYRIVVQDPNRNAGIKNIPNSVNVVFSISTTLIVNPSIGRNSTPVLLNPPYDKAAFGHIFIHNPAAYDPDGDSLSYALTVCTREDGKPIENYTLPPSTKSLRVDAVTGDLIWDTPADTGKFNVAMEIQEWRNGKKIGMVVRDMQIEVYNTNNKPPINKPLRDYCVEVGKSVNFIFSSTDANGDSLMLQATSGLFGIKPCPATFTRLTSTRGSASSRFTWTPCHEAVRNQPYNVIFKADDNNKDIQLADIDNINIKVLGPSPHLLTAIPEGKLIRLSWDTYGTSVIAGFSIYRTEGATSFVPDSCTSGIPASSGFIKVGYIAGSGTTTFIDSDNGAGLQFGKEYTYRIVAVYPNGTESKASNEVTSSLVSGVPVIRNVSITATSTTTGSIFVAWKKPDRLDTIPALGPYQYLVYRATGITGTDYTLTRTINTADLNDTSFVDTPLNTATTGYIYRIELYNNAAGNRFLIGDPAYASSVFITVTPGDRKANFFINRNVPWINTNYEIFRFNPVTSAFEPVGSTNLLNYSDVGLQNAIQYRYYVRATGSYPAIDMPKNLINLSQEAVVTPVDNEPPCPPSINVSTQCDSLYNVITWSVSDSSCYSDVAGFRLYYKQKKDDAILQLMQFNNNTTFSYKHYPGDLIAGCYAVSAYDIHGNESPLSVTFCIDSCDFYEIPNVFTPNGDGINDRLIAKTSGLVEKVDFKLFNRNGLLIFSTSDPRLDWDGTYNGKIVSPGVYFYSCDVYEMRITGLELFHLSGFVHVITEKGDSVREEVTR